MCLSAAFRSLLKLTDMCHRGLIKRTLKDPSVPPLFLSRQTTDGDSSVRRCGVTEEKNVGHVRRQQQWKTVAKVGHIDREARIGK